MAFEELIGYIVIPFIFSEENTWGIPARICLVIGFVLQLIVSLKCERVVTKLVPLIAAAVACAVLALMAVNTSSDSNFAFSLAAVFLLFFAGYLAMGMTIAWAVYGIIHAAKALLKSNKHSGRKKK